jgi:hypothetical protein
MGGLSCMAREFGGRDDKTPFVGYVPRAGECGTKALEGWGSPSHKLRVGPGFYGSINNLAITSAGLALSNEAASAALKARIYLEAAPSTLPAVKLAMAFNDGGNQECSDAGGPGCQVDNPPGQPGVLRDGAYRGLIQAVPHDWNNCPGVDYWHPESPCNTEVRFSGGACYKESVFDLVTIARSLSMLLLTSTQSRVRPLVASLRLSARLLWRRMSRAVSGNRSRRHVQQPRR